MPWQSLKQGPNGITCKGSIQVLKGHLWTSNILPRWKKRSPLVWTKIHPPLADAWLQIYTWNWHLDNFMPWTDSKTNCITVRPPLTSHAIWNLWWVPIHQCSWFVLIFTWPQPSIPRVLGTNHETTFSRPPAECHSKLQTKDARGSHVCILLPSMDKQNLTWMEGRSPLVWTMLHSALAEAQLQTYAWNGHLKISCLDRF